MYNLNLLQRMPIYRVKNYNFTHLSKLAERSKSSLSY